MTRRLARVGLLAWVTFLVGALVALRALGGHGLGPPPLTRPGQWQAWLSDRTPDEAALALARLVAVALASYLLAATGLSVATGALRAARLARLADALTLPAVRRLTTAALGISLATAPLLPRAGRPAQVTVAAGAAGEAGDGPGPAGGRTGSAGSVSPPPVLRRLPEPGPPGAVPGQPLAADPASGGAVPAHYTIERGGHLWRMATETLTAAWGRPPSDRQVAPYWLKVIDANRHHLVDPANPDLVFPGQVMDVPPPPPPPG